MRSEAASPSPPFNRVLTGILVAALVVLAVPIGGIVDIGGLVTALGLLNISVIVFLLLRRDITWGFLFYLTAVIFFQTGFWFRLPGFPDLYPSRIAAVILFLVFQIQILLGIRKAPRLGPIEIAMLCFTVVLFISVITGGQTPRWLMLMRGYLFPFIFFYFARSVISRERQVRLTMAYLVGLGVYLGVMGVFEKLQWYEFVWPRFIVDPTLGDKGLTRLGFRVRGIFMQPAVLGCVMTMGFFPAWLYLSRIRGILARATQVLLLLVTPSTIFFTQTRSVYLGFLCALLVAMFTSRRLRILSLGIVLAGMTAAFLNWENLGSEDRDVGGLVVVDTIHYRIELVYEAADIFMESPFVGCGFMNFEEAALRHRKPRDVPFFGHIDLGVGGNAILHNMLISVIAEQGLLGLVPYLLVYWFILRISWRAYRELPSDGVLSKDFVVCVWCAMAAYFVNAMFLEMRFFEYINVLYFFLMGSMVGIYERHVVRRRRAAGLPAEKARRMAAIPWSGPRARPREVS